MPRAKAQPDKLPAGFDDLVRLLPPQAIHDEVGYSNTQEMIDRLTSLPRLTTGQAEYLETLTILFEAYEKEHERIDTGGLSPLDMLHFLLESNGMSGSDLGRLLGSRELGPKILNGTRQLSKAHIRRLADRFKVDAGLFL
ncbi:MAG: family transcriptional regulator [Phycisphaerales bacterium]|nr:family transcriptional regulator [Phycisphaerales bacterium]